MIISILNRLFKHLFSLVGKRGFSVFFLIFFAILQVNAQSQTIQGTIKDETGKPLPSVSVTVKGTTRGTVTNESGSFTMLASSGDVLVVSSVGFENKEIKVGNESNITISLTSINSQLSDVIVVGYGTQKRTAVTGAISTVNSKTIK